MTITKESTNEQIKEELRKWDARTEVRPSSEEYARFQPLKVQWEKLNAISEARRTPWQAEAHAVLLAELITTYDSPWFAWTKPYGQDESINAAFTHHVAANKQ
jgi:hypothetical protein